MSTDIISGRPCPGERENASLGALFGAFLKVSLCGFGGGIVWARRIAIEQRQWISDDEFTDIISFCQFMPGPNVIGIAVCVGMKLRGAPGAMAAVAGFILIPWTIGFSLGWLYLRYARPAVFQNILTGISAAAAGLLIATGIRMLMSLRTRPLVIAALAFGGMTFTRLPFLAVLFGLALLSITLEQMQTGRSR
jgi:chromate transporter